MSRGSWISSIVVAAVAITGSAVQAQKPKQEKELIVLLSDRSQAPRAEEVVERHRQGLPLPGNLGTGGPQEVRFGVKKRAHGPLHDEIEADRDSPRGRLERYVVMRYPSNANLNSIRQALLADPNVVAVQENVLVELAVTPSDPMFPPANQSTPPNQYQWGSFTLNLPGAWDYQKGHAYVGTVDTGIDTTHPDLGNFRPHLSYDFGYDDDNVDEGQPQMFNGNADGAYPCRARDPRGGHHRQPPRTTASAWPARCWNCSLLIAKVDPAGVLRSNCISNRALPRHARRRLDRARGPRRAGGQHELRHAAGRDCRPNPDIMCDALAYAAQRDVFMVAASGNGNDTSARRLPGARSTSAGRRRHHPERDVLGDLRHGDGRLRGLPVQLRPRSGGRRPGTPDRLHLLSRALPQRRPRTAPRPPGDPATVRVPAPRWPLPIPPASAAWRARSTRCSRRTTSRPCCAPPPASAPSTTTRWGLAFPTPSPPCRPLSAAPPAPCFPTG